MQCGASSNISIKSEGFEKKIDYKTLRSALWRHGLPNLYENFLVSKKDAILLACTGLKLDLDL